MTENIALVDVLPVSMTTRMGAHRNLAIKVRCHDCGAVNHWTASDLRSFPELDGLTLCVCWQCGARQDTPLLSAADAQYLAAAIDIAEGVTRPERLAFTNTALASEAVA